MAALPPQGLAAAAPAASSARVPPAFLRRLERRVGEAPRNRSSSRAGSSSVAAADASARRGIVAASASASSASTPPAPDKVLDELQSVYPPPASLSANAEVKSLEEYRKLWRQSLDDPAAFWGDLARREFFWTKEWDAEFTR